MNLSVLVVCHTAPCFIFTYYHSIFYFLLHLERCQALVTMVAGWLLFFKPCNPGGEVGKTVREQESGDTVATAGDGHQGDTGRR